VQLSALLLLPSSQPSPASTIPLPQPLAMHKPAERLNPLLQAVALQGLHSLPNHCSDALDALAPLQLRVSAKQASLSTW
jgi:hypothetical protein